MTTAEERSPIVAKSRQIKKTCLGKKERDVCTFCKKKAEICILAILNNTKPDTQTIICINKSTSIPRPSCDLLTRLSVLSHILASPSASFISSALLSPTPHPSIQPPLNTPLIPKPHIPPLFLSSSLPLPLPIPLPLSLPLFPLPFSSFQILNPPNPLHNTLTLLPKHAISSFSQYTHCIRRCVIENLG
jgi:hypothetical protein